MSVCLRLLLDCLCLKDAVHQIVPELPRYFDPQFLVFTFLPRLLVYRPRLSLLLYTSSGNRLPSD